MLSLAGIQQASAQKFSYVDSEYILEQLPEYRSAQKQLDDAADGFKKELIRLKDELDKMKQSYEAEFVLLPEDSKKKREEEISLKQKEYDQFKKDKFGPDGEVFKKRTTLIKPIQDKVFDAVQRVAKENNQDFIFDKAGGVTMLVSNAKYDRSDEVLEILGVGGKEDPNKPGQKKTTGQKIMNKANELVRPDVNVNGQPQIQPQINSNNGQQSSPNNGQPQGGQPPGAMPPGGAPPQPPR